MKIVIVGAGAMGSMTGGLLKEAGEEVHLYSVNKQHIEMIKHKGLAIEGIGMTQNWLQATLLKSVTEKRPF